MIILAQWTRHTLEYSHLKSKGLISERSYEHWGCDLRRCKWWIIPRYCRCRCTNDAIRFRSPKMSCLSHRILGRSSEDTRRMYWRRPVHTWHQKYLRQGLPNRTHQSQWYLKTQSPSQPHSLVLTLLEHYHLFKISGLSKRVNHYLEHLPGAFQSIQELGYNEVHSTAVHGITILSVRNPRFCIFSTGQILPRPIPSPLYLERHLINLIDRTS